VLGADGLMRIDPATNAVVARIAGPDAYSGSVLVADGSVWYSSYGRSVVVRVDPATNQIAAVIPVDPGPEGLAANAGTIWVASHYGWTVDRIDTATNAVTARIPVAPHQDCCGPQGIATAPGAIWVAIPALGKVARIDPSTNAVVALIPANGACGEVAADSAAAWVTASSCGGPSVVRVNAQTNAVDVRGIDGVYVTSDAVVANGSVYVGSNAPVEGVVRVDPVTGKVTGQILLPGTIRVTLAYGDGALWVRSRTAVVRVNLNG
jgi:streptogramin lyase